MEFKVGDEVICIESDKESTGYGWQKDYRFTINKITSQDSEYPIYWKGLNGCGVYEHALKLAKEHKPKTPTHIVIWEEDRDPCKFFESEDKAKEFIKELSEKSNVTKDSIVLVEIKSARKIKIQKSLRYLKYTI